MVFSLWWLNSYRLSLQIFVRVNKPSYNLKSISDLHVLKKTQGIHTSFRLLVRQIINELVDYSGRAI
jgi:hypothetical protein